MAIKITKLRDEYRDNDAEMELLGYHFNLVDGDTDYDGFISTDSSFDDIKPRIIERHNDIPRAEFEASKSRKLNEFLAWASAQSEVVHEFQIGSKTIKLKANDKTKSNLQDLKGTLDDMIALGIFNPETQTFDAFYNEGETAPISITYTEVLQVRVQLAQILENLYTLTKTIPAQLNAINLDDYESLEAAIAAVEAISYEK